MTKWFWSFLTLKMLGEAYCRLETDFKMCVLIHFRIKPLVISPFSYPLILFLISIKYWRIIQPDSRMVGGEEEKSTDPFHCCFCQSFKVVISHHFKDLEYFSFHGTISDFQLDLQFLVKTTYSLSRKKEWSLVLISSWRLTLCGGVRENESINYIQGR